MQAISHKHVTKQCSVFGVLWLAKKIEIYSRNVFSFFFLMKKFTWLLFRGQTKIFSYHSDVFSFGKGTKYKLKCYADSSSYCQTKSLVPVGVRNTSYCILLTLNGNIDMFQSLYEQNFSYITCLPPYFLTRSHPPVIDTKGKITPSACMCVSKSLIHNTTSGPKLQHTFV